MTLCAYDCASNSPAWEHCLRCHAPLCMDCACDHWMRCPSCYPDAMERLDLALISCRSEEDRKRILRCWPHIPSRPRERRQGRLPLEGLAA